jgi:hypothetical protein
LKSTGLDALASPLLSVALDCGNPRFHVGNDTLYEGGSYRLIDEP